MIQGSGFRAVEGFQFRFSWNLGFAIEGYQFRAIRGGACAGSADIHFTNNLKPTRAGSRSESSHQVPGFQG